MAKESLRAVSLSPHLLVALASALNSLGSTSTAVDNPLHKPDHLLLSRIIALTHVVNIRDEKLAGLLKDRNGALLDILVKSPPYAGEVTTLPR